MADCYQTIVDTRAGAGEADHLARHVVSWLAEKGVVKPSPSQEGGYDRGDRALEISLPALARTGHELIPPVHSHLQVLIGRMTHSESLSEFHEPRAGCPACGKVLHDVDGDWQAATQDWLGGDDAAALLCGACGKESPVASWVYGHHFGYGLLAFRFWNWPPLKPSFLDEMRRELNHPIVLVEGVL
jgi:hypothetical protein